MDALPAIVQATEGLGLGRRRASVAIIGSGTPDVAAEFAALFADDLPAGINVAWYCDPSGAAHRALGLHRGVVRTFTWRRPLVNVWGLLTFGWTVLRRGWCCRECSRGRHFGDQWQQGGAAVVATGGGAGPRFSYVARDESPGWPPLDGAKLAAAVREAAADAAAATMKGARQ